MDALAFRCVRWSHANVVTAARSERRAVRRRLSGDETVDTRDEGLGTALAKVFGGPSHWFIRHALFRPRNTVHGAPPRRQWFEEREARKVSHALEVRSEFITLGAHSVGVM